MDKIVVLKKYLSLIENKINKNRKLSYIIISLIMTFCVMGIFWAFIPPRFTETNDDLLMACFGYGYMSGAFDSHLVFINIIIGYLLKFCLTILPNVAWYTVFQVVITYISFVIITYLVFKKFGIKRTLLISLMIYLFFGYEFFCSLQFTKTAAVATISGMLLLFDCITHKGSIPAYIIGFIMAILGSLYRMRAFEMTAIFMGGVGLYLFAKAYVKKDFMTLKKLSIVFACLFVCAFGFDKYDDMIYKSDERWTEYTKFNKLRAALLNRKIPDYYENEELYNSLNMTFNDYQLFSTSNLGDVDLFTSEMMEKLIAVNEPEKINFEFLKKYVKTVIKGISDYSYFPLMFFVFLIGLMTFFLHRWDKFLLLCYQGIAFLFVEFYFLYRNRYLQNRVDVSIILGIVFIVILYILPKFKNMKLETKNKEVDLFYNGFRKLLTGFFIIGLIVAAYRPLRDNYWGDRSEMQFGDTVDREIRNLIHSDKEHFYLYNVAWNSFPDKMYNAWKVGELGCGNNTSSLGTWRFNTPIVLDKLAKYNIRNPYIDMINNENIYLMTTNDNTRNMIVTHMQEHYDENCQAVLSKYAKNGFKFYRIQSEDFKLDTSKLSEDNSKLFSQFNPITVSQQIINNDEKQLKNQIDDLNLVEEDNEEEVIEEPIIEYISEISGILFEEGQNSFATNIYVEVVTEEGSKVYMAAQYSNGDDQTLYNGQFGTFKCKIASLSENATINIYLETSDKLYKVPFEVTILPEEDENKEILEVE